jgi:hypothetical protein
VSTTSKNINALGKHSVVAIATFQGYHLFVVTFIAVITVNGKLQKNLFFKGA